MNVMFGLFNLGGGEIILILALVLILFGAKKLPELAKGLGTGIKEFKKATRDVTEEMHSAMEEPPPQPPRSLPPAAPQPEAQQTIKSHIEGKDLAGIFSTPPAPKQRCRTGQSATISKRGCVLSLSSSKL